jgi:hypothetical protein
MDRQVRPAPSDSAALRRGDGVLWQHSRQLVEACVFSSVKPPIEEKEARHLRSNGDGGSSSSVFQRSASVQLAGEVASHRGGMEGRAAGVRQRPHAGQQPQAQFWTQLHGAGGARCDNPVMRVHQKAHRGVARPQPRAPLHQRQAPWSVHHGGAHERRASDSDTSMKTGRELAGRAALRIQDFKCTQ